MAERASIFEQARLEAVAILREAEPLTTAEQAAAAVLEEYRWVFAHAEKPFLAVMRLLRRRGLLRDLEYEEHLDQSLKVNAEAVQRDRTRDAVTISSLMGALEQAAARLEAGEPAADVARWLRKAREQVFADG